jgi:hypothetical protein
VFSAALIARYFKGVRVLLKVTASLQPTLLLYSSLDENRDSLVRVVASAIPNPIH